MSESKIICSSKMFCEYGSASHKGSRHTVHTPKTTTPSPVGCVCCPPTALPHVGFIPPMLQAAGERSNARHSRLTTLCGAVLPLLLCVSLLPVALWLIPVLPWRRRITLKSSRVEVAAGFSLWIAGNGLGFPSADLTFLISRDPVGTHGGRQA